MINKLKSYIGFISIFFTLGALYPQFCFSQNTPATQDLTASVEVEGFVKLEVNKDYISLGGNRPGESTEPQPLSITCMTNVNEPWSIAIHVTTPLTSEENFEIPNTGFNWQLLDIDGKSVEQGTMDVQPFTIYTADMAEYVTETPVELTLLLSVDIPPGQAKGAYETVVIVTMQAEAGQF